MQKHTKIYMDALGYKEGDFIPCERTGNTANDTHHIISRGKGGEDRIENLMALTRKQHLEVGDKKQWIFQLLVDHEDFLKMNGVQYDKEYMKKLKQRYAYVN